MPLVAPFWLLLLVPWLAAVIYLMLGKPPRQAVPFLSLWRGPDAKRQVKPSISKLPAWIALLLLAAGVAIVAAARPRLERNVRSAEKGRTDISHVAVRHGQVMVRVLNVAPPHKVSLAIGDVIHTVDVPTGEGSFFFDIARDQRDLVVRLIDGPAVHMLRRRTWPKVDARMPLPPALRRMVDTYAAQRPAGDDSTAIVLADDVASLGAQPGVILGRAGRSRSGNVSVTDHAVTRDVNWAGLLIEPQIAAAPPDDFTPLVRVGDQPVLAVRESPRQVWVGFDTSDFAGLPEYVIFWSNVFDFTGQGDDVWEPKAGTAFVSRVAKNPVQTAVQNLAPWLAMAAVALSAVGVALAPRVVA